MAHARVPLESQESWGDIWTSSHLPYQKSFCVVETTPA